MITGRRRQFIHAFGENGIVDARWPSCSTGRSRRSSRRPEWRCPAAAALKALRTDHVVDLIVGPTRKRGVTGGCAGARQVLTALDVTEREPPGAPEAVAMATC